LLLLRLAAVVAAWLWRFVADGKKVQSPNDLFLALDKYRVGDIVDVSLLRDGKTIHAKVPLEAVQ
jgi:S1-C subfamily serine protease